MFDKIYKSSRNASIYNEKKSNENLRLQEEMEKKLTKEHRKKISEANRKRKGIKLKKRVDMPQLSEYIKQCNNDY